MLVKLGWNSAEVGLSDEARRAKSGKLFNNSQKEISCYWINAFVMRVLVW